MKERRIYAASISLVLFFLLFKMPKEFIFSFAIALLAFGFGALLFYKKPELANFKIVDSVFFVFAVFGAYCLLNFNRMPALFLIIALGSVAYAAFAYRAKGSKTTLAQVSKEGRLALRTDMCFNLELRRIKDKDFTCKGITKDLSTTGMRVFSEGCFNKSEIVYFKLYLPQESWPLTGEAEVIWAKPAEGGNEYGLTFTNISDQNRGKLALRQGFSLLE
ncbi:MAG: PilZ domain-containing protein [Candidatus Omnitrophica bacterium]|nr:PilZ domain-containing protein [Candidatus Omnitrophota bacterium]